MKKYVPVNKQSKKAQKEYYAKQRKDWGTVNPAARTFSDKKSFTKSSRNKEKAAVRKLLDNSGSFSFAISCILII